MEDAQKKKLIDKIKKLFSLGESSNKNESENALRMAKKLMKKHDISSQEVDQKEIVEKSLTSSYSGRGKDWQSFVCCTIATAFSCESYSKMMHGCKTDVYFVGERNNVNLCIYSYHVIYKQVKDLRLEKKREIRDFWVVDGKSHIENLADAYALGLCMEACNKLRELCEKPPTEVRDLMEGIKKRKHKKLSAEESIAISDGIDDAENVNIFRPVE